MDSGFNKYCLSVNREKCGFRIKNTTLYKLSEKGLDSEFKNYSLSEDDIDLRFKNYSL